MQHLNAVKDYLLLARGDFFQGFLADASRLLASPPREAAAANELGKYQVTQVILCSGRHGQADCNQQVHVPVCQATITPGRELCIM